MLKRTLDVSRKIGTGTNIGENFYPISAWSRYLRFFISNLIPDIDIVQTVRMIGDVMSYDYLYCNVPTALWESYFQLESC